MRLEIRLFANFRQGRFKTDIMELPQGLAAGDILNKLEIRKKEVGILLVNGKHGKENTKLKSGDIIAIFPSIGGG